LSLVTSQLTSLLKPSVQRLQPATMPNEQQRKANLRLALILATVVAVFGLGFVARMIWFR
jgi:hypothetical protein